MQLIRSDLFRLLWNIRILKHNEQNISRYYPLSKIKTGQDCHGILLKKALKDMAVGTDKFAASAHQFTTCPQVYIDVWDWEYRNKIFNLME